MITQLWPDKIWQEPSASYGLQTLISTLQWFCRTSIAKTLDTFQCRQHAQRWLQNHKLSSSPGFDFNWFNNVDKANHCSRPSQSEETVYKFTSTCMCPWFHYIINYPEKNLSRAPLSHISLTKCQYTQWNILFLKHALLQFQLSLISKKKW